MTINASTSVLGTATAFTASRHVAQTGPSSGTPLFYVELQPSASFTVTSYPSFSVTLPSSISTTGENFYVAFYSNDPVYGSNGSWDAPVIGPATVSGQTVSFTGGSTPNPITLSSSYYYIFCVYETSSTSPSPSPSTSPSSSPTAVPQTWTFGGTTGSEAFAPGTTTTPISLAAYHNIGVTVTFAEPISGSGTLQFSDALNNALSVNDVTPDNLPVDNATANYTPIIYVSTYNAGTSTINFGANLPEIQLVDTSLSGVYTNSEFDVYGKQPNSNAPTWFTVGNTGSVSGSGVTVGPATLTGGNNMVDFQPGQQIIAVSCH